MATSPMKRCSDLADLHPFVKDQAEKVVFACREAGLEVDVFETLRTLERQKWLKSNGKSTTLSSYHRLGLAVDFVFKTAKGNWTWDRPKEDWDKLADIVEAYGFSSGWRWKSFKDGPHAQMQFAGIRSTSLYKKLDELGGDITPEFNAYIDRLIKADPKLAALLPKPKKEPKPPAPEKVVEPVVVEKPKVPEPVADKTQGILGWIISLILALLGKK